jgi:hypothetical protein
LFNENVAKTTFYKRLSLSKFSKNQKKIFILERGQIYVRFLKEVQFYLSTFYFQQPIKPLGVDRARLWP